jgi:hypothetical protein
MKHAFNWRRPLFYCLIPFYLLLALAGFPPPFAPPQATKPGQEQSVPAAKRLQQARRESLTAARQDRAEP